MHWVLVFRILLHFIYNFRIMGALGTRVQNLLQFFTVLGSCSALGIYVF